ncbi:hypothetical protein ACWFMI_15385 [Nocardiopsis terrae]
MNADELAHLLPEPAALRELCRRTALLEFLVAPGNRFRRYDHTTHWRPGWDLATMANGAGDDYSIAVSEHAGLIRCFDHESPRSPYADEDHEFWPGTVDALPDRFRPFLDDPGFTGGDESAVTALLWWLPQDTSWRTGATGSLADGSGWLLDFLYAPDPAQVCQASFRDDYGRPLDLAAVRAVLAGEPLTGELVAALGPGNDPADLLRRAEERELFRPMPR